MTTVSKQHSSYWLDKDLFNDDDDDVIERDQLDINRIARLAAVRRAIANFVSILSGKNVPVEFSSGKQSYTDGAVVVISAEDKPEKFDPMVGLALHEGSHILLTDFNFIQAVMQIAKDIDSHRAPMHWYAGGKAHQTTTGKTVVQNIFPESLLKILPTEPVQPVWGSDYDKWDAFWANTYWKHVTRMIQDIKDIMNILEDRRIDKYVYQNAQGYRPYYDALYNKYFFTTESGKNLKFNPEWREITIENYINRLLLAFHPAASPDAMPGLRNLINMMDLNTIERVAPTENEPYRAGIPTFEQCPKLWQEACNIYGVILSYTGLAQQQNTAPQPAEGSLEELLKGMMAEQPDLPNLDQGRMEPVPVEKDVKGKGKKQQEVDGKFNDKKGKKEISDAKKIMNGEVKKKNLKKAEKEAVDALDKADAQMVDIKGDGIKNGKCMVLRKMTPALLGQDWFIFGRKPWDNRRLEDAISAGRRMGALLQHRLQVRNDPMMTKQTRLPHGGLDRRLLAQLGMEITSVFQKSRVDTHRPVVLHLSLDASGSMSGSKWHKVVTVATAIAHLSSKMQNVEAVISIRGGNELPMVAIMFDSRKNQLIHFLQNVRSIQPAGATPEGLAFKATMDLVLENADTHDVYFINFSDGEPAFSWYTGTGSTKVWMNYGGEFAANHTKAQIRTMRDAGVKILSYFITDGEYINPTAKRYFNIMYGENASFVNVQNAGEVLRTLNKLLLTRGT